MKRKKNLKTFFLPVIFMHYGNVYTRVLSAVDPHCITKRKFHKSARKKKKVEFKKQKKVEYNVTVM